MEIVEEQGRSQCLHCCSYLPCYDSTYRNAVLLKVSLLLMKLKLLFSFF